MITPILIYFLKVNLALAFLYICYRLLFRDDTFFRLRRGVLLSIYLIAFLYPLPDLSGWLSTQTSVAGIVGYYSGLLPKGEFYQFNLSSCIRQQNSLTAQFVSFSLSNLANIFYPPRFLQ